jgi:hypothetical protein
VICAWCLCCRGLSACVLGFEVAVSARLCFSHTGGSRSRDGPGAGPQVNSPLVDRGSFGQSQSEKSKLQGACPRLEWGSSPLRAVATVGPLSKESQERLACWGIAYQGGRQMHAQIIVVMTLGISTFRVPFLH